MEPKPLDVRPPYVETSVDQRLPRVRPSDFESFYRQSWHAVYRPLAATFADADLASEAVDEAMVRAFSRWRTVRRAANPEGWVYRVAYRWGVDRLRRQRIERKVLPRFAATEADHEPRVEPRLNSALEALPVQQRAVVVLACVFDWSQKEIAEALQIRPGTVKSRLHRGLARLREELGT